MNLFSFSSRLFGGDGCERLNAPRYVAFDEFILPVKQKAGFARIYSCEHGNLCRDFGDEPLRSSMASTALSVSSKSANGFAGAVTIFKVSRGYAVPTPNAGTTVFGSFLARGSISAHTVIAHQSFGDMLRSNPPFHAIVLEGGFDDEGTFFYIPVSGLQSMTELFRPRVIKLLVGRELLAEDFAGNLLSWKHSGFSIDNSVRTVDESTQESLAEYTARPPMSLKKIRYERFNRSDSPQAISQTRQGAAYCFTPRTRSTSSKTFTCLMPSISSPSSPDTFRRSDCS